VGSNFPINAKLAAEETNFDLKNPALSGNARHKRWEQLMQENKGKIDVAAAQKFLADHVDSVTGKSEPSERTLCGHVELSPRGMEACNRHSARLARCKTKLLMQRCVEARVHRGGRPCCGHDSLRPAFPQAAPNLAAEFLQASTGVLTANAGRNEIVTASMACRRGERELRRHRCISNFVLHRASRAECRLPRLHSARRKFDMATQRALAGLAFSGN